METSRHRWAPLMALVVLLPVFAGCSSSGPNSDDAAAAATALYAAVAAGDGGAACDLLAAATAEAEEEDQPCADAITQEGLPAAGSVAAVEVAGRAAQVQLVGDTVFLTVEQGRWKVMAAGCTPREQRPYDCAIKAG